MIAECILNEAQVPRLRTDLEARLAFEIISIRGAIRPTLSVALEGAISHNNA
jgi:hypothetical protein